MSSAAAGGGGDDAAAGMQEKSAEEPRKSALSSAQRMSAIKEAGAIDEIQGGISKAVHAPDAEIVSSKLKRTRELLHEATSTLATSHPEVREAINALTRLRKDSQTRRDIVGTIEKLVISNVDNEKGKKSLQKVTSIVEKVQDALKDISIADKMKSLSSSPSTDPGDVIAKLGTTFGVEKEKIDLAEEKLEKNCRNSN